MTTGLPENHVGAVFSFGHRTTITAGTTTFLPGVGGTNQAAEIALVIPENGTLKNLRWDCQSNGLTGATSKFIVKVGDVHASPTAPAPALVDALTIALTGGVTSGLDPFGYAVVAGQRVAIQVQAVGGTNISRLRVSFDLEVQRSSTTWQLDADGSTVFYDGGNVGIGTTTPGEALSVDGIIESTSGGFRFPDDSVQTTAAFGAGSPSSLQGPGGTPPYALVADDQGRIGVGTTEPQEKLALAPDSNSVVEMTPPTLLSAVPVAGGGLPPDPYYFRIVAEDGAGGATIASNELSVTIVAGSPDRSCQLAWTAVQGAASYRVYIGDDVPGGQDHFYRTNTNSFLYVGETTPEPWAPIPSVTTAYVNKLAAAGPSWLLGGSVGIGTTTPTASLDVAGTVVNRNSAGGPTGFAQRIVKVQGSHGNFTHLRIDVDFVAWAAFTYRLQLASVGASYLQLGGGYVNGPPNFSHVVTGGGGFGVQAIGGNTNNTIRFDHWASYLHPVCIIEIVGGGYRPIGDGDISIQFS